MKSLMVYYSRRGENYGVSNIKKGNSEHIAQTNRWELYSNIKQI